MRKFFALVLISFFTIGLFDALSQDTNSEIDNIIERLNTECPLQEGCEKREFSYSDCTIECFIVCGGNEFAFSIPLKNIRKVFKDKADFEDKYETLFLVCIEGEDCITCDSAAIPPAPVFPIKLPEDESSTLGEDAVKVFSKLIEGCK